MKKSKLILSILTAIILVGQCNSTKKINKNLNKVHTRGKESIKSPIDLNDEKETKVVLEVLNKKKPQIQNLRRLDKLLNRSL